MVTMTAEVKDDLARLHVQHPSHRRTEVATLLRFSGGLQISSGQVTVSAELDTAAAARRLRADIHELFGLTATLHTVAADHINRPRPTYIVRIPAGPALARQTGLLDRRGRPVRGLPATVVGGTIADAEAVWRGAFLARGTLSEPGRANALTVIAPSTEAALALVGVARRMGIPAKAREIRDVACVSVREEAVTDMLTRMGAGESLITWQERHCRQQARVAVTRLASFDDANLRRSTRAAVATAARAKRALEILGPDTPDGLAEAGRLRVDNEKASLDELARMAHPPMTKDAMAGRIRRLLANADREALRRGIPATDAVLIAPDPSDSPALKRCL